METELMAKCGVCGTRGTHNVGAETAAPAVGCHCGVIVTGFTESEATERWTTLARRAELGRIVEAMAVNGCAVRLSEAIDLAGPHRFTAEFNADRSYREDGSTLLDALRSLEKEVCGES